MDLISDFKQNGFVLLKGEMKGLDDFERAALELFTMQASKIDQYRKKAQALATVPPFEKLSALCEMMEAADKEALYQVQKFFPSCPQMRRPFDAPLRLIPKTDLDQGTWLIDGPGIFINRPGTERLLYKWHSEQHYYPKRRLFYNAWFPLFDAKTKANGTMSFKVGSHKRTYPFSEYQGYNRDTQGKANYFIQYEIPENFVSEFEEHYVEAERGDLVIFHSNLVHRSNANPSDKYSFAGVARIWNPTDDLTLAGSLTATPYGHDSGRPGLFVNCEERQ